MQIYSKDPIEVNSQKKHKRIRTFGPFTQWSRRVFLFRVFIIYRTANRSQQARGISTSKQSTD